MKYLNFVAADGRPAREDVAVMQREIPGWEKETQGVRLLGRALDLPHTARTVRVRDSRPLVTDGPFVEAKEFIAGFDLLECSDLDECIAVAATAPVARFLAVEIRPFASEPRLDEKAASFGRFEDGAARPYALAVWAGGTQAPPSLDQAVLAEGDAWRREAAARGLHILGGTLEGADAVTTLRVREGKILLTDGPFFTTGEYIAAIDVVSCADQEQAVQLAATHPAARSHPIEVRPFENE
jgi:hypothetical protein